MQTQFHHARFHARRHVAGTGGIGRDRQTPHSWLNSLSHGFRMGFANGIGIGLGFVAILVGHRSVQTEAGGILLAGFEIAEHRTDGIAFVKLDQEFLDASRARRSNVHGRFAGFDLDDILVGAHLVANANKQVDDSSLGDGFAQLRHDDRNGGHGDVKAMNR